MNSRERVTRALNHQEPDRLPVDLGTSGVTGIHAAAVCELRAKLGLPALPPRITECFGMMGEVAADLQDMFQLDVVGLLSYRGMFGYPNTDWKPWRLPSSGAQVLVPGLFNTEMNPDGSTYQYPCGDQSVPPSGKMPPKGLYFDNIYRQPPLDEDKLDPRDNASDFQPVSEEELTYLEKAADDLYRNTDKAILTGFGGTNIGDIALVPGPWVKHPKGIREMEEWYISLYSRRRYLYDAFSLQCETALGNLARIHQAVGNKITAVLVSGTDFGGQTQAFMGNDIYRELFKPFHQKINGWIHQHTTWKTFQHSCGAIEPLIPEFIEAGFDILNPVQCNAAGMDAAQLKRKYGDKLCFWGGGVDTQTTMQFGTPDEVRKQVRERVAIFRKGGGFVFTPVHNIQAGTPVENILSLFETLREIR